MYDAIVVGARCAGSPTAMLLARQGYRVLLLDRARFPSDIPHGHFIHVDAPARLKRWGLLDRIVASNCPPVNTVTTDFGDFPLTTREEPVDGVAMGYGPRRKVLDKILVEAAVEAGAELREGFTVEGFVGDGDRITGIRGRDIRGGRTATESARITIGADGRHSLLARVVGPATYEEAPTMLCYYFTYWSGVPNEGLELHQAARRVIIAHPTNDDLFLVAVGWPIEELPRVRADIEGSYFDAIGLAPDLAERLRAGRREERFYGASNLPNYFRKPFGPGWALVGDAGCHKDPYLALGISDAFRDAELLAGALDAGLSGRRPLEAALSDYERLRNQAAMPDYAENLRRARLDPLPAEALRERAALRESQAALSLRD